MAGCFGLFLQAQKGDTYFTELAEREEYGNCVFDPHESSAHSAKRRAADTVPYMRIYIYIYVYTYIYIYI